MLRLSGIGDPEIIVIYEWSIEKKSWTRIFFFAYGTIYFLYEFLPWDILCGLNSRSFSLLPSLFNYLNCIYCVAISAELLLPEAVKAKKKKLTVARKCGFFLTIFHVIKITLSSFDFWCLLILRIEPKTLATGSKTIPNFLRWISSFFSSLENIRFVF